MKEQKENGNSNNNIGSNASNITTDVYLVKGDKGYAGYLKIGGLTLAIINDENLQFVDFVAKTIELVNQKLGLIVRFRCIRNEGISQETDKQFEKVNFIKKGIKDGRNE